MYIHLSQTKEKEVNSKPSTYNFVFTTIEFTLSNFVNFLHMY